MFVLRVTQALDREHVPYALVGGYAVSLHGVVRATLDVDVVLPHEERYFVAAAGVFKALGLEPRIAVSAAEVFQRRAEFLRERNMLAWAFCNPDNPTELVDVLLAYDLRDYQADDMLLFGVPLKVLALRDLIRMKRGSPRQQDHLDAAALERLV